MSDNSAIIKQMAECVRSDMAVLQAEKIHEKMDTVEFREEMKKDKSGCLFSLLSFLAQKFGKKTIKMTAKQKNFEKFNKDADNLLKIKEIKEAICKDLHNKSQKEILSEDIFVETITGTLGEYNLRTKHSIEWNSVLFAHIAFKISEIGYSNFCGLPNEN